MVGGPGLPCWLGVGAGTDFKQRQTVFDREFSDAWWETWRGGVEGGQVTAGRQVRTQTLESGRGYRNEKGADCINMQTVKNDKAQ